MIIFTLVTKDNFYKKGLKNKKPINRNSLLAFYPKKYRKNNFKNHLIHQKKARCSKLNRH
jgi:hypothetical protein